LVRFGNSRAKAREFLFIDGTQEPVSSAQQVFKTANPILGNIIATSPGGSGPKTESHAKSFDKVMLLALKTGFSFSVSNPAKFNPPVIQ
jgi:hypothetical protein